ncbi:glycosyl hydrolase family 18 protein [Paradesulfitobacterium ferrireducens]|uniref:glycosyl hydrolase family 18 protein n=1 Tax=Paradesulfitobacterium ferrireducens TaxID=2816476 RepID=UPI001AD94B29|nr:glycosyl hydrolase family 18 protein [Paradesulfitobacterium ferrireducens]
MANWTEQARRLVEKRLWVLGYTAEDYPGDTRSLQSLRQYSSSIDVYADFAYLVRPDASFTGNLSSGLWTEAKARGIAPLVLFHNFSGSRFDPELIGGVLSSSALQRTLINNILELTPPSAAGVHLDFEAIRAEARVAYVSFLESMAAALHRRGQLLTLAVPAKRSKWEGTGYDFEAIGRLCDAVTIMTYDEHYSAGEAGPVASLPWMTQALDYAVQHIPRTKVLVGIPVYGYDWSSGPTRMTPMRDIPDLVTNTQARILWSDPAVEPYFYYWQGREKHTVWFENELSAKIRFGFVKSYRLRGIAIWRLGYENSRYWQGLNSKLKR